jgi:BirA family biotin operon repressor/biotin-[acetyl-CoA-carboxylase] ligase
LKLNTLFVGNVARHFAEIDSTNLYAVELLAKTKPSEGTVISADFQQAGRGQIGSNWYSSRGKNLLLSLIWYPRWLLAREQFSLSQAMALAVADTAATFCPGRVEVKWPNDVYLNGRKIAGTLIQNSLSGSHLQWSVVGIGLNVNEMSFPADLPNAASLAQACGHPLDLEAVRQGLLVNLEKRYLSLKANSARIRADYLQKLYQYQSWHTYRDLRKQQFFRGQIIGVEKSGKLAIQSELGSVEYFDLKEVGFL